jgi:RNA polymerase sigma factor (sigma-70 family)
LTGHRACDDDADPVTPVEELVRAATRGEEDAWAELVRRYTPLVVSVIRGYGLGPADAADVNQTVWLRLVEYLDRIREPLALAGWLAKTAGHECLRLVRASRRIQPFDPLDPHVGPSGPSGPSGPFGPSGQSGQDEQGTPDDRILRAERRQVMREGFAQLPQRCRHLLTLLMKEPPATYEEVGERLGIPIGSIGPTRARCLHKLRTSPVVAAFLHESGRGERDGATALRQR